MIGNQPQPAPNRTTTMRDIARLAGVSVATVSRVLHGSAHVDEETRVRVGRILAETHYIPNLNGPALLKNRTHMLALVLPDITNPFFTRIARAFEYQARLAGSTVIMGNTDENVLVEQELVKAVLARRVDGIALAPAGVASRYSADLAARYHIPLVLLDREIAGLIGADVIKGDNYQGMAVLVEHLAHLGHRRLALLAGPAGVNSHDERVAGFLLACRQRGIEAPAEHIRRAALNVGRSYQAALALLQAHPRPTAVVATSNFPALGCLRAARALGLRIPQDLALVAFDDIEYASLLDPFLTVVVQPARRMGLATAKALLQHIEGKAEATKTIFRCRLVVRESCGATLK